MPAQDHYKTLQVTHDAEPEVIGAAYKLLAFKYHPDRNPGSACDGRMQELNDAYETLRDPQRRHQYDAQRNAAQAIPDVSQYVHSMLDQGLSPNEVVKNLISNGFDLETSARIVGTIVELRLSSTPSASVPTTPPPNSTWWVWLTKERPAAPAGWFMTTLFCVAVLGKQYVDNEARKKKEDEKPIPAKYERYPFSPNDPKIGFGDPLKKRYDPFSPNDPLGPKIGFGDPLKDLYDKTKPKTQEEWQRETEKNRGK